ncbi:hypothetical protein RIF29_19578 [Crotalaria pallida]|uniref:Uncharacterized protein n=1 Tax=Crotalaria pallida TaxID=3830 RepID=A0AAN9I5L7_CROPI
MKQRRNLETSFLDDESAKLTERLVVNFVDKKENGIKRSNTVPPIVPEPKPQYTIRPCCAASRGYPPDFVKLPALNGRRDTTPKTSGESAMAVGESEMDGGKHWTKKKHRSCDRRRRNFEMRFEEEEEEEAPDEEKEAPKLIGEEEPRNG